MKKNLISILILALLVVNVVLTAIMMFSVTGTAKKTAALVTNIASVLNIELGGPEEETEEVVLIADSEAVDIMTDEKPIQLKMGDDGKPHFCLASVSIHLNKKHEDYETLKETVATNRSLLQGIISEVIGGYTYDEIVSDSSIAREAILKRIQTEYNSTFIYKVTFGNIIFQ